jgi:hypothetical protein
MRTFALLCFALLLASTFRLAQAQAQAEPPPIDADTRHEVIAALSARLQSSYVFPEVADELSKALADKAARDGYRSATDAQAFAQALTQDLRELGRDKHFSVFYDPQADDDSAAEGSTDTDTLDDAPPSAEAMEAQRRQIASYAYGIDSVRRLPGNVGYLEVRGFGPTEFVAEALSAAMTILSGTDALILDLRRNGGGEAASVAYLMSHFFALGDERHLNDLYFREKDLRRQYWTTAAVPTRYLKPVYVLTSSRTFSGGEECAYNFQTQKRATLVGETTGGGANPGNVHPIARGFVAFIPEGRAINPITQTSWEHVGVQPDIAVPAADAQRVAHAAILRELIQASPHPGEQADLQELLAKVESDTLDPPDYRPRN